MRNSLGIPSQAGWNTNEVSAWQGSVKIILGGAGGGGGAQRAAHLHNGLRLQAQMRLAFHPKQDTLALTPIDDTSSDIVSFGKTKYHLTISNVF
ncbi:hypothetical protein [Herbaspirillum sp. RV1423]|uniref:hypothetical protein n=1 Tax=Herbaspirillum sp. RV1423 TaxID=1443993 RepID=UPI0012DF17E5|nr:hypothetical protein [Herbaspirillum sp. RV1423]